MSDEDRIGVFQARPFCMLLRWRRVNRRRLAHLCLTPPLLLLFLFLLTKQVVGPSPAFPLHTRFYRLKSVGRRRRSRGETICGLTGGHFSPRKLCKRLVQVSSYFPFPSVLLPSGSLFDLFFV